MQVKMNKIFINPSKIVFWRIIKVFFIFILFSQSDFVSLVVAYYI